MLTHKALKIGNTVKLFFEIEGEALVDKQCKFSIKNLGNGIASVNHVEVFGAYIHRSGFRPYPIDHSPDSDDISIPLPPGDNIIIDVMAKSDRGIVKGGIFFFAGRVIYTDPLGDRYAMTFALKGKEGAIFPFYDRRRWIIIKLADQDLKVSEDGEKT